MFLGITSFNSLGSATTENYVGDLFRAYSFVGKFCGFRESELEALGKQTRRGDYHVARLADNHFKLLISKSIEGEKVMFPTEKFLKNQNNVLLKLNRFLNK